MYRDDNNDTNKDFVFYNNENNESNENVNWEMNNNDENHNYIKHKKKSSNKGKIIGGIAIGLGLSLTGGLIGGAVTYKVMRNSGNIVAAKSYAPPQFANSTDGALSATEAFEKVKPAVVTISTKGIQTFNGFFSQEVSGIGSGFIINEDGYILTNYHVIEGAKDVSVLLSDGREVKAKVVNYDQAKDMAMIKLEDGTKVPGVAELGDSDALYPGEDVIAIGTPLSKDFAQTVTKGVVSSVNRNLESNSGSTMNVIQTDTAINPGNSGGPLVNTKGQVIGINSMKLAQDNVEGMGFAIPINEARDRIEGLSKQIITIGIKVKQIDEKTAKENDMPEGLYVKDVEEYSPAERAGIKIGDVITKFDGKRIKTFEELSEIKNKKKVGDTVEVVVERRSGEKILTLELAEN